MTIDIKNKIIYVAAAIILDHKHRLLLVRKRGTAFYMQVGGKLEKNESAAHALIREIKEEIQVTARIKSDLGVIQTQAANEAGFTLYAHVFEVEIDGTPQASAEIESMQWLDLSQAQEILLAPLTKDFVIPFIQQQLSSDYVHG